jgi:hypothetical protein
MLPLRPAVVIAGTCLASRSKEVAMSQAPMPSVGDAAPPVRATITGDGEFDLAAHRGKWVVVYFYPRANTPG